MKDTIRKEYLRRTRNLLETKLSSRNLIKGINTWAVPLVRHSGPFLKWTREELKQMDQRTRKLMAMHKALQPRDDVDRLYVFRKEGGRGLASIEDTVDASIQQLEDYIEKHERGLITAIRNDLDLARELKKLWNMKVTIVPIVIGSFGTITKGLLKGLEDLEFGGRVETIQMTAL